MEVWVAERAAAAMEEAAVKAVVVAGNSRTQRTRQEYSVLCYAPVGTMTRIAAVYLHRMNMSRIGIVSSGRLHERVGTKARSRVVVEEVMVELVETEVVAVEVVVEVVMAKAVGKAEEMAEAAREAVEARE